MPEITYIDDEKDAQPSSAPEQPRRQHKGGLFVVFFLILSLLMGAAGSIGVLVAMQTTDLAKMLGINKQQAQQLGLGQTDHIVLEESSAITDSVDKVSPAVVSITTTQNVHDFFGRTIEQKGGGTGFILTSDGLIVTNKHVVSDDNATYHVFTNDGKDYEAKIVARDSLNDLAVIKIEASGLPVVELGSSDDLKVGQWVIAIGNALGEFNNTVTVGVISAKERQITADGASGGVSEDLSGLLQTDAAINLGNSGGPLVNLKGQVVGINTAIAGNAQSIGFAIPINLVNKAIQSIKDTGKISRPMLGIRYVQITKEMAKINKLPADHGVLVLRGTNPGELAVIPGSPADKAGIQENDIVTEIDGKQIDDNHSLLSLLATFNVGDKVKLTIFHQGDKKTVELTLTEQTNQ
jgi:serine protease Do